MQPFNQSETGYTNTAKNVTFTGTTPYDPALLDNPVRARVNYLIVAANRRHFRRGSTL